MSSSDNTLEPLKMDGRDTPRKEYLVASFRVAADELELIDRVAFHSEPRVKRAELLYEVVMREIRARAAELAVA